MRKKIRGMECSALSGFLEYFLSIVGECMEVCQGLYSSPDTFNE
jgi:hypothetical protein